ncbi:hypothetical protein NCCP691_34590 [Noviherbaspirillum aridicola]|uniref:Uncharacterized protein n=1 Tax=Noviherbaspirillum aridicola TaxID=2849687 RepID=A0ABQ4Q8D0_9BURK|nr:hypothetical protein NCCP691_34590 [Noviherbaspirillum aridicola]
MPSASPTRVALSPPGMDRAWTENTGRIRNMPSMRSAKIDASETLARISVALMREPGATAGLEDMEGAA